VNGRVLGSAGRGRDGGRVRSKGTPRRGSVVELTESARKTGQDSPSRRFADKLVRVNARKVVIGESRVEGGDEEPIRLSARAFVEGSERTFDERAVVFGWGD
jgi:hypothetical protein